MKTQIDIKSAVFGLVLGVAAMFALGAGFSNNEVGTYRVSVGQDFMVVVNTKTGEAWGKSTDTIGQPESKSVGFWSAK